MPASRLDDRAIEEILKQVRDGKRDLDNKVVEYTDVFIAGSGPIGATYAQHLIKEKKNVRVIMAEIGAQENPVIGAHHKNSVKYQKDIDAFVNVIKGALQPVSIPPADSYLPTLGGDAWAPAVGQALIMEGHNPNQNPQTNLKATAITRTVGGMATHWTCACPKPHKEESSENPIPAVEFDQLLDEARKLLNVHDDQYNESIRHTVVKETLKKALPSRGIANLPLAVQRDAENPRYVTWSGTNTVLGDTVNDPRFTLLPEHRVTRLIYGKSEQDKVDAVLLRDLRGNRDRLIIATTVVVACGAICTPQILANSAINPPALGKYLCEQSLAFCQIVLKRSIVEGISTNPAFKEKVSIHKRNYPNDPLPIPFTDPEPQVMIPYSSDFPYHVQVHRDAFSYGDVGPKSDPRVVVDLRFFGKQDINEKNRVVFGMVRDSLGWHAGITDTYGMPQATFEVTRSAADGERDQRMMQEMTAAANALGAFLPGSNPQFMEPGLALHITGTTRIGTDTKNSVADPCSRVHGFRNLWVGGNGCIPDSTACNPTRTSVAIALKGAKSIGEYLDTAIRPKEATA